MSIDPIANLISLISNGYRAGKVKVSLGYSKEKESILKVLKNEGYIRNTAVSDKNKKKLLLVRLQYQNGQPAVTSIKRISKPGQRIYARPAQFKPVLALGKTRQDLGTTIVSTSQGIMTGCEAKKKNIGGELLLKVY